MEEKVYYAYFSDDHKHDQTFVKTVLDNMLQGVDLKSKVLVTESDNCMSQYKSVKHVFDIQTCSTFGKKFIRAFGIAVHGITLGWIT